MEISQSFWNSSIDEIKNGYIEEAGSIKCLVCGEVFTIGRVYEIDGKFYDARKTAEIHMEEKHNSMLNYLLNMNPTFTGISEVQKNVLELMAMGLSDKEIAQRLKVANSTIRNHRYKLREKEKQAKVFLAMMDLLENNTSRNINILENTVICDPHKTATTLDDRFNITDEEKVKVIENYMDENKRLKSYPAREKKKVIILEEICKNFKCGKKYSEKEINRILQRIFDDYVTLRRALIEYGFLDRSNDCSEYWVKE
ncbi:MAG: DUF2087 domain-containing protein [Clostridium sp.]|nr:DUF2087 domain-containing protein [Clostridium sp.]